MKIVAIVQARMGSTRLPNKVMKPICGIPMIELLLGRLSRSKEINQIVVATSIDERNVPLVEHVRKLGYACEQGNENDVLDRYLQAARNHNADVVVRITGDCPVVDPELVDHVIAGFKQANVEYFSNINPPTYPDGLDIEVFKFDALDKASREASEPFDREHVTPYLRKPGKFKTDSITYDEDLSSLRWTVDESSDFEVIEKVFKHFYPGTDFSWTEVLALQHNQPELFDTNSNFASSRFTPTVAGYYQINAQVANDYGGSYNAGTMGGAIYKNGSVYAWQRSTSATAGYAYGVNIVSSVVYLNGSTDYVELYGFNPNASPVFLGGSYQTSMSGVLVRAA